MSYPLVRELAEDGIPATVTCRVLNLARQPHYRWLTARVGARELAQAHLANALFDAHHDDPEYGCQLLADEAREAGDVACDRHDVAGLRVLSLTEDMKSRRAQPRFELHASCTTTRMGRRNRGISTITGPRTTRSTSEPCGRE